MQASAQWIFAFGNRSLKALQVIIITCFAVTLIICFYASALFWFKVFSPPAPPLRTVGYCFIGTSCRFSTFIPSSLLMVYLIQSLHSCFIFITNSFPCSRTLGKKEKKKKKAHETIMVFSTIPLHSLPFFPMPGCLFRASL